MRKLLITLAGVGILNHRTRPGQAHPSTIRGVWQAVEVTMTGPNARTITIREPRPNLTMISAAHYSHLEVQSQGPRHSPPDVAKATGDELRAAWGPFAGEAGVYEIGTNTITTRPIVAKNPTAMVPGAFTTYSIKLRGDTLWLTEQRTYSGPVANPATVKLVRVE